MIRRKRILLCSLVLLLGIFCFLFKRIEAAKFGGFDVLEPEELTALVEGKTYVESPEDADGLLALRGQKLAYDRQKKIFYVSQLVSERNLICHFEVTNPKFEFYVEKTDSLKNVRELIQAGESVRLWAVYGDCYAVLGMVISGAPVMRLDTSVQISSSYGEGEMTLIEPDADAVNGQNIKNTSVIAKKNISSQTYSLKLMKEDYADEKKLSLLDSGEYSDWKLYAVSENDGTLMRAKLASDLWNVLNSSNGPLRTYSFVEVVENDSYKGLYLLTPKWSKATVALGVDDVLIRQEDAGEEQIAALTEMLSIDDMSDYILFLQLVYAYHNIADDCVYIQTTMQDGSRQCQIVPDKIEYAFGGFSNRLNYLAWGDTSRMMLTAEDFGVSEDYWTQEIMPACSVKWRKLREQVIDVDLIKSFMQDYRDYMVATGLEKRCIEGDSFGYHYGVLEKYVTKRIDFLDECYAYVGRDKAHLETDGETADGDGTYEQDNWEGFLEIALAPDDDKEGVQEQVKLFVRGSEGYFFLPSYWNPGNVKLVFDHEVFSVKIDGNSVAANTSLRFANVSEHELSVSKNGGEEAVYHLNVMQSQNLPTIFISTYNMTMDYVNQQKGNTEPGSLICIGSDGAVDCEGDFEKIKMHGNTSVSCLKKTYQLQFTEDKNLLSMGAAKKWILQANAYDGSYMRNRLAYELAKELGLPYAVETGYADVYLNQEYAGNYLVCEKIELGTGRIEISDEWTGKTDEIRGDINAIVDENDRRYYEYTSCVQDISGNRAYLIEAQSLIVDSDADRMDEEDCYFTSDYGRYEVRSPEQASQSEVEYINQYIQMVGQLIADCDSARKYTQLKQYIDTDSFAAMYLVDMLTNDVDANEYSTFYYKYPDSQGGKLCAGPVWDYDRAFGNERRNIYIEMNAFTDGLCEMLFANEEFQSDVRIKFDAIYMGDFFVGTSRMIEQSVLMDEVKWAGDKVKLNYSYMTFQDEAAYLEYYYEKRYEFLQGYLHETNRFCTVTFVDQSNRAKKYYIRREETLPEDILEFMKGQYECDAWYREDGMLYEAHRPVFGDMVLYGR